MLLVFQVWGSFLLGSNRSTKGILKAFDNITLTIVEVEGQIYPHLAPFPPRQEKITRLLRFSLESTQIC
jgi:hypothetical protein